MSGRPRLVVLDDREGRISAAPATSRLRELADVCILEHPLTAVPDAEVSDVKVVMAIRERTRLDARTLARFPQLELVLQTGGHAYHLDARAARERGILVALGRRAVAARAAVSELTIMLAIAALRRVPEAHHTMASGGWSTLIGRTLAGRRLGLLGTGRHGQQVARVAQVLGMEVVAWARPGGTGAAGIRRIELDELLATSDVISIHLRLSDQSRGLLDRERLRRCKAGAILVNTARGPIVDEDALVEVLRDGPLAAAGLDVFTEEPLPADSALRSLPNVVLTPHIGWTVEEVFDEFASIAADQLEAYLAGALDTRELLDETAWAVRRPRLGGVAVPE